MDIKQEEQPSPDYSDINNTPNHDGLVSFPQPQLSSYETLELGVTFLIPTAQPLSDTLDIKILEQSLFSYFQQELLILCFDYLTITETADCILVSKYWQNVTKLPRVWIINKKKEIKERKVASRAAKIELARTLYNRYQDEVKWRPWLLCKQMSFQTPYHDLIFQILTLTSLVLAPLQLDQIINISWIAILLPVIFAFFLMVMRVMAVLIHDRNRFERYRELEDGTIFMQLGVIRKSQIRWVISISLTVLSLILFLFYLSNTTPLIPLYLPLIPVIIVSLLIIESTFRADSVPVQAYLCYIPTGAICAFISLILLSLKWSGYTLGYHWYIIHIPLFLFYLLSFLLIFAAIVDSGLSHLLCYSSIDQFQKILWIQGIFSLFYFQILLLIKLDLFYTQIKFWYCFLSLWIWCITNFPVIYNIFSVNFVCWLKETQIPTLLISPSKRKEIELQKYNPVPE